MALFLASVVIFPQLMSPTIDVLISIASYSQDAAAAFMMVSIAVMRILLKRSPAAGDEALDLSFVRVSKGVARMALYSFCWMCIAGMPEVLFSPRPVSPSAGDLGSAALFVRYSGMLLLAGIGLLSRAVLSKKIASLQSGHAARDRQ